MNLGFVSLIVGWLVKNSALLIGIIESVSKLVAGIVSITPTKSDDKVIEIVDKVASAIKKVLYTLSDKLAGKEVLPN